MSGERPFREELTELFRKDCRFRFERPELFSLMTAQYGSGFQTCSAENRESMEERHKCIWTGVLIPRVRKAIAEGEIRDIAPEAVAGTVHGAIDSLGINQWDCETLDELFETVDMFMLILFEGISRKERQS
jgi:hypothetical protein